MSEITDSRFKVIIVIWTEGNTAEGLSIALTVFSKIYIYTYIINFVYYQMHTIIM